MGEELQIAGVRCAQCERKCVSDDDGAPCECGIVLHRDGCWREHWSEKHAKDPYRDAPPIPKKRKPKPEHEGDLPCVGCARFVAAPTNLDLLGFPRFTCPRCGTGNKLPLTSGRRLAYRIIVGVIGVGTVIAWINGIVAVPGLLAIAVVYALVKDASLRSEVEARELGHASEPKRKRRAKP